MRPNMWPIFHTDQFTAPPEPLRCQSGPLFADQGHNGEKERRDGERTANDGRITCQLGLQFVPGRFFVLDEGDVGPFLDAIRHEFSITIPQRHAILPRIERETR